MSISSAARSTTASATRFFRFSQADEPIFESGGSPLPPPTYFCTRSILAIGTYSFVPSANSRSSVSSSCSSDLVDQLEAAVAGDPVVDVDDQVPLVQVEEAVDRPALVPPAGRRPADVGAGEQLVVADDERPGVDHVEARRGSGRRSGRAGPTGRSSVSAKTSPSRSTSAALWQAIRTRSPAEAPSSSALTLVSSPENRSTLSIRRWQVVSSESAASVESGDRGELDQPGEASLSTVNRPARVVDPAEVVPALLAEVVRLDQGDPGPLGEGVGGVAEGWPGRRRRAGGRRSGSTESQRSSERWVSASNGRIDSTSSPKNSTRTGLGGVGREDVEDAAAEAELAGDLDDLDPRHPPVDEPGGQLLDRRPTSPTRSRPRRSAPGPRASAPAAAAPGTARRRTGAGVAPAEPLDHPEPPAEDLVARRRPRAGSRSQAGKTSGVDPGEGGHVVAEVVDVADVGQRRSPASSAHAAPAPPRRAGRPSPRRRRSWRSGRSSARRGPRGTPARAGSAGSGPSEWPAGRKRWPADRRELSDSQPLARLGRIRLPPFSSALWLSAWTCHSSPVTCHSRVL